MTHSFKRKFALVTHLLVVAAMVAALGSWALLALLVNPHGMSSILGVPYNKLNTTTVTDLTNLTPKARQELWVRRIIFGSDRMYQDNPFADGMMGSPLQGKAIVQITDTEKVAGNTVNIPTVAGFGGPGVAGEGDREGAEQKIRIGNFTVQIGRFWFGVSFTSVAVEETVIGGPLDELINDGLKQQMAKKKSDDTMKTMLVVGVAGTRNYLLPPGRTSVADLSSADVFSTTMLSRGGLALSSLGGKPMKMVKDSTGSTSSKYVYLGTNYQLLPLDTEDAYLDARKEAGDRGSNNAIWTGRYDDWLGHGMYRWEQVDHGNYGPVGSPLLARAFLGVALTGTGNGSIVKGGGSAAAAAVTPKPLYFENFANAPWVFFNNTTIAADSVNTRYVIIINYDGSFGVFPYVLNDGNQITLSGAKIALGLPGTTETTTFLEGALIHQCNIRGTCISKGLYLAQEAVVSGAGSINGSKADPQMGRRTQVTRNHDMDHAIGVEGVWGCAAVKRADGISPGFLVVETAVPVPGAPIIPA